MIIDYILLDGPSITHREIECAADAAAVGWNMRGTGHIRKFQSAMCAIGGQQYAFATCNCSAALHLALLALNVGPGDEVLVPEIADISAAWAVMHTGATPVFCDVDPRTLCLNPESAAMRITVRTKAVLAVHLYGQLCDMAALTQLAVQHNIALIEDATQGLGALWHYQGPADQAQQPRPGGSFGIFSVFSFNSHEAVVAGEGGMLLCSNERLMARAAQLGSSGRSPKNPFVYDLPGFNYSISNLQAALGVAQLERLPELLAKKKEIFGWYKSRLGDVSGIRLNAELPECKPSYLMTVLHPDEYKSTRSELLRRLLASQVLAAPVFYPLSSMPFFRQKYGESHNPALDNPVAYGAGARAVMLPSGYNRTEEEVEYVSSVIKALLREPRKTPAQIEPTGWLLYKSQLLETLAEIKRTGLHLPFTHEGVNYELRAVTADDAHNPEIIKILADLRRENQQVFLRHGEISENLLRGIMENYLTKSRDFILFFVAGPGLKPADGQDGEAELFGHMGLDNFDFRKHECVAEAFMMRQDAPRGLAAAASETMYAWAGDSLGVLRVYNHVRDSNKKVKLLAAAQGFKEINRTALYKQELSDGAVFRPMYIQGHDQPDEYFVFSVKELAAGK